MDSNGIVCALSFFDWNRRLNKRVEIFVLDPIPEQGQRIVTKDYNQRLHPSLLLFDLFSNRIWFIMAVS